MQDHLVTLTVHLNSYGSLNNVNGSNGRCFDGQVGNVRSGEVDPRSLGTESDMDQKLLATESETDQKVLISEND